MAYDIRPKTGIGFELHLPYMPTATAQQKGYSRKTGVFYEKKPVKDARRLYEMALKPHRPAVPFEGPLRVNVTFLFPTKNKKLWGYAKATRPDVDNIAKLFLDCMTACGFWHDDSQIASLTLRKGYNSNAIVLVEVMKLSEGRE